MTDSSPTQFFARPWLAAALLSWTVGVIDAFSFATYGVFTSNQAGNLVVLGTALASDPRTAQLAAASLLGAVAGVAITTVIQKMLGEMQWLKIAVPTIAMVVAVFTTWLLKRFLDSPDVVLVPLTSAALAGLATALLRVKAVQGWITANTGALLTSVLTLAGGRKPSGGSGQPVQSAAMITLGFFAGALAYGSGVLGANPTLPALIPALFVVILALLNQIREHSRAEATQDTDGLGTR